MKLKTKITNPEKQCMTTPENFSAESTIIDVRTMDHWTGIILDNPEEIINEMRLFKDSHELAMMQHAARLSAAAHCLAMRACKPGMYEYQLASILEASYLYNGANAPAYGSIVAVNGQLDGAVTKEITSTFIEAVISPGYQKSALDVLKQKKDLQKGSKNP